MDDMTGPLARVIYEAHARERQIKTTWSGLGGTERAHWMAVSSAVLAFWGEYAGIGEEESTG